MGAYEEPSRSKSGSLGPGRLDASDESIRNVCTRAGDEEAKRRLDAGSIAGDVVLERVDGAQR